MNILFEYDFWKVYNIKVLLMYFFMFFKCISVVYIVWWDCVNYDVGELSNEFYGWVYEVKILVLIVKVFKIVD